MSVEKEVIEGLKIAAGAGIFILVVATGLVVGNGMIA